MFKVILLIFCLLWNCATAVADTAADLDKGKQLYHSYGCALCHGWDGKGDGINAQKFDPPPTDFHDPKAYLHGRDRDSIRKVYTIWQTIVSCLHLKISRRRRSIRSSIVI